MTTLEKIAKLIEENPTKAHEKIKYRNNTDSGGGIHVSLVDLLDSIEEGLDLWIVPDTVTLKVELPREVYNNFLLHDGMTRYLVQIEVALANAEVLEDD